MLRLRLLGLLGGYVLLTVAVAHAADEPSPAAPGTPARVTAAADSSGAEVSPTSATGRKFGLIIRGLSGDAMHREKFDKARDSIQQTLVERWGWPAENVLILDGDQSTKSDQETLRKYRVANREELQAVTSELAGLLTPADQLWVFVIGHAHYDGRDNWLNLPGPDISQQGFGKLFEGINAGNQVFFLTFPCSGFYLKPLAKPGRITISATEAGLEPNATEFPTVLASLLATPPTAEEADIDADGKYSLLDLYLLITRRVAQLYQEDQTLATEHALIDDNGDGRGTELQIDFLTEEQGGRWKPGTTASIKLQTGDGPRSQRMLLPTSPPAAPTPPAVAAEAGSPTATPAPGSTESKPPANSDKSSE